MFNRQWSYGVIIVAILIGVMFVAWPSAKLQQLLVIPHFIEAVLPILAIGALLKYLLSDTHSK